MRFSFVSATALAFFPLTVLGAGTTPAFVHSSRFLVGEGEICEDNGVAVVSNGSNYRAGVVDVLGPSDDGASVVFTVSQIFGDDAWMSVVYPNGDGYVCNQQAMVPKDRKLSFKAICGATGTATVDVYVHNPEWGSNAANPASTASANGSCEGWPGIFNEKTNVERISYQLSCSSCDFCEEYEEIPPPPVVPNDPDAVCEGNGVSVAYENDNYQTGAIDILQQSDNSDEVIFSFSQLFSEASSVVSVVYKDTEEGTWTCDSTGTPLGYQQKRSFKAACEANGIATVDVYVHNADWTSDAAKPSLSDRPGQCATWTHSSPNEASGVALFKYELACGVCADCVVETDPPTSGPTAYSNIPIPPVCESDDTMLSNPGSQYCPNQSGVTALAVFGVGAVPEDVDILWDITGTSNDDSSSVSFQVQNPFPDETQMFVKYHSPAGVTGGAWSGACDSVDLGTCGGTTSTPITAQCLQGGGNPFTLIRLYFIDSRASMTEQIFGPVKVDECCYPPEDVPAEHIAQYSFLVRCSCPEVVRTRAVAGPSRRRLRSVRDFSLVAAAAESQQQHAMDVAAMVAMWEEKERQL